MSYRPFCRKRVVAAIASRAPPAPDDSKVRLANLFRSYRVSSFAIYHRPDRALRAIENERLAGCEHKPNTLGIFCNSRTIGNGGVSSVDRALSHEPHPPSRNRIRRAADLRRSGGCMGDAVSEWRPIKTAPKDGTEVLLYDPDGVESGATYTKWYVVPGYFPKDWDKSLEGWLTGFGRLDSSPGTYEAFYTVEAVYAYPTHWMPLPEPPK